MAEKENAKGSAYGGASPDPSRHHASVRMASVGAPVDHNEELRLIQESLGQIEAILKAESKRRFESNQLTEEYILDYLDKLEQNLNNRVLGQFKAMERRITLVDGILSKIEGQFDFQDQQVNK